MLLKQGLEPSDSLSASWAGLRLWIKTLQVAEAAGKQDCYPFTAIVFEHLFV